MRRIISMLVENGPVPCLGSRVVFTAKLQHRNLDGCAHGRSTLSRLTVTTVGSDRVIEQITKQLNKLIEVKVVDLTEGAHIERELMLIKLKATGAHRAEIKRTVDIFRGQIVDVDCNGLHRAVDRRNRKAGRVH